MKSLLNVLLVGICLGSFLSTDASAEKVFDFSDAGVTWTAGSLMQTYTDVDNSGVDIKITISGDTDDIQDGYPALDMSGAVIAPDDQKALWFRINSYEDLSEAVTADVEFFLTGTSIPAAVTDVSAVILDIDYIDDVLSTYRDDIRDISAMLAGSGTLTPATATANTAGTPSFDIEDNGLLSMQLTGTADSPESPDNGSDTGDATIDFGTAEIKSFTYSYGNRAPLDSSNPSLQFTALQSIHFQLVPEPSSVVLALTGFSCFSFLAIRGFRRKRRSSDRVDP